jgi:hypothetical protein
LKYSLILFFSGGAVSVSVLNFHTNNTQYAAQTRETHVNRFKSQQKPSAMASRRTRYIPELIYTLAFSSISVNLLWQRRAAETDRRHYSARLSILGELAGRLRVGGGVGEVTDAEVARLRRLAETVGEDAHAGESIGWRDVIFGRKESGLEREGKEELERRELERGASRLVAPLRGVVARPAQVGLPFCARRLVRRELHREDDIAQRS